MNKQELVEALEKANGERVILRGFFGDTYVNIGSVQEMSNGDILLQSEPGPMAANKTQNFSNLEDLVLEIKEFVGTEPELFNGIGIGLEKAGEAQYIYLESEEEDGTYGIVSLEAEEAIWLSEKLIEYAGKLAQQER